MTVVEDVPTASEVSEETESGAKETRTHDDGSASSGISGRSWSEPRWIAMLLLLSMVVMLVATIVVIYAIGPLIHEREQRSLVDKERAAIANAARDDEGLYRPTLPTLPPTPGSLVGILAIPAIGLQQAVVEGAGPSETISGPGHVPGTAGLGQPGNSAIVGRRSGYGGPFGELNRLRVGDRIVTATLEGQSVYVVRSVRQVSLVTSGTPALTTATTTPSAGSAGTTVGTTPPVSSLHGHSPKDAVTPTEPTLTMDSLLGPSTHNQLTLVTSAAASPWNSDQAVVVVARLHGLPYTPEPQESRSLAQQGNSGDPTALSWLLLYLLALAAILIGSIFFYRRTTLRTAYLLTTGPLIVFTILAAEACSRMLPAWL